MRRLLLALLASGCAAEPPLPEDDYIDLDAVLAHWTTSLAALDAATPGQTAPLQPTAPSPARDSAVMAALTHSLAGGEPALRVPTPVAPAWGPLGEVVLHADADGDRVGEPDEAAVAALTFDPAGGRLLAQDREHPSLLRSLPVPAETGLATAYVYGRMAAVRAAAQVPDDAYAGVPIQEPGYHTTLPAR